MAAGHKVNQNTTQNANLIFGAFSDDSLGESIKVTIIITGFAENDAHLMDVLNGQNVKKPVAPAAATASEPEPAKCEEAPKQTGAFVKPNVNSATTDIPELPTWLRRK